MGIRVLVIEDDAVIADFIVRGLREEGYTVEFAANGISRDQLRRAAGKLGVTRTKASMKSGWLWSPPSHPSAASTEEGSALFEEPTRLHCERKPCDTPIDGAGST